MRPRPLRRRPWALARRLLGCDPGAFVFVLSGLVAIPQQRQSALRRGGGGHSSMASARCARDAETVHSAVSVCPHSSSAVTVDPLSATAEARCDGVGRRPKTPLDGLDERSPAPATTACGLPQARGNGTAACGARETAQELHHGCGDDCSRSASLAALHARTPALLRAVQTNATCTSLAHKACV